MARTELANVLLEAGLFELDHLEACEAKALSQNTDLASTLLDEGICSEDELAETLSIHKNIPLVRLNQMRIPGFVAKLLPMEKAEALKAIPVSVKMEEGVEVLYVAFMDPTNLTIVEEVQKHSEKAVRTVVASRRDIEDAIRRYYRPVKSKKKAGRKRATFEAPAQEEKLEPVRKAEPVETPEQKVVMNSPNLPLPEIPKEDEPSLPPPNENMFGNLEQDANKSGTIPTQSNDASSIMELENLIKKSESAEKAEPVKEAMTAGIDLDNLVVDLGIDEDLLGEDKDAVPDDDFDIEDDVDFDLDDEETSDSQDETDASTEADSEGEASDAAEDESDDDWDDVDFDMDLDESEIAEKARDSIEEEETPSVDESGDDVEEEASAAAADETSSIEEDESAIAEEDEDEDFDFDIPQAPEFDPNATGEMHSLQESGNSELDPQAKSESESNVEIPVSAPKHSKHPSEWSLNIEELLDGAVKEGNGYDDQTELEFEKAARELDELLEDMPDGSVADDLGNSLNIDAIDGVLPEDKEPPDIDSIMKQLAELANTSNDAKTEADVRFISNFLSGNPGDSQDPRINQLSGILSALTRTMIEKGLVDEPNLLMEYLNKTVEDKKRH